MALTITHWKSKPLFPGFKELVDWCHKIYLFLFSIHLPNFTQCFTRATHEWMDLANHSNISGGRTWRHHFDHKSWEQTRQIWGIWKLRPAYSPETPNLGQNRWCFVPCDLEIWWMTLENNRASLLCCFKLCATFHSHRWIQTGVTVRIRPIWVKFDDF